MLDIEKLIFDEWNIEHIARHGVEPSEVAEACSLYPTVSKTYGGRLRVIGQTAEEKVLVVILAPKSESSYYPVTARPASRKERAYYQRVKREEAT